MENTRQPPPNKWVRIASGAIIVSIVLSMALGLVLWEWRKTSLQTCEERVRNTGNAILILSHTLYKLMDTLDDVKEKNLSDSYVKAYVYDWVTSSEFISIEVYVIVDSMDYGCCSNHGLCDVRGNISRIENLLSSWSIILGWNRTFIGTLANHTNEIKDVARGLELISLSLLNLEKIEMNRAKINQGLMLIDKALDNLERITPESSIRHENP